MADKRYRILLVKPSHYDDDGYVIQWMRSFIPSNSLASVHGLIRDSQDRRVLGPDVDIEIKVLDETNAIVDPKRLIPWIREAEAGGFLGLVGVQSNQFPRAMDLARPFRKAGVPVAIGGFHVSGCKAMLPKLPPDIQEAADLGCVLYCGEAEGRMDAFIQAMANGTVEPIYDYMTDLPEMARATVPYLPREVVARNAGRYSSFDAGRGCPFQCSFCTIINVQGRKSRFRTADDIETIIRENLAQGIKRFFITDDNFARNKNWEEILDRCIHLREVEKLNVKFILQVDTLCHKTPGFIEKAVRAGAYRVFIGLENVNPDNLTAANKRQNKIWEYRAMLQEWKRHGALTYAGYILGFPGDTPEKIKVDLEIIKRELPLDLVEFFILTPLPGSEDHAKLAKAGTWMDPDMNKYDLEHVVTGHPVMTAEAWQGIYDHAWELFYTPEHVETILRRGAATGLHLGRLMLPLVYFADFVSIENVHPLQGGWFRRRLRKQRRPGLPLESPLTFYPRRAWEIVDRQTRWVRLYLRYHVMRKRIAKEAGIKDYMDAALAPVGDDTLQDLQLMKVHGELIANKYGAPDLTANSAAE